MEARTGNGSPRGPDDATVKQLLEWNPELGVISVYVAIDPADRRESWRVALRDQLKQLLDSEEDKHERRRALEATIERIQSRFPEDSPPSGRCQIGFCEVARDEAQDLWFSAQMARDQTEVVYRDGPHLSPLLELLDEGAPVGVVTVSAERVRLYEWSLGTLADVQDWEAVLLMPEWRERKAQSSPDPARVQGSSSSGRDQFDQRLDANRQRFLEQVGGLTAREAKARGWHDVLAFGDAHQVSELADGAGDQVEVELADDVDLIAENDHGRLLDRINEAVDRRNRRRELALVKEAIDAAMSPSGRGATGLSEIESSLTQGRVRHLLLDAESDSRDVRELEDALIEAALRTSARVTPVEGEAAEALREHGGVAALLRY
jgi:peptide subunit release factor 1 (eRF1)